ncbi:hypothetical protein WA026_005599 [Henosepilachna vigintioctopunctata]|uniref:Uncharacterized protein n=1 Tax=Henosepilachna vigintioctopunctata TaxID=420089 RepID=A0AAW1TWY1_9CUCU
MSICFQLISSLLVLVVLCDCSPKPKCDKSVACSTVLCSAPPSKCPKGYRIAPAGFCLCCEACIRIVHEDSDCSLPDPIIVNKQVVCADGLECKDNVCIKV